MELDEGETMPASVPESLAGVGVTAIGVALIRARETGRADRLFDDPYAQVFADAAKQAFLDPAAPSDAADTWSAVQRLVDVFYEGRSVDTRFFDDYLLAAAAAGCEQVVILGAGLDTRAFRLPWPHRIRLFELDLPEMFSFKEDIVRSQAAEPSCARSVVPADLREDWALALSSAGFRAGVVTAWLAEGLLSYLSQADARQVLTTVAAMTAPGSRFACEHIGADTPGLEGIRALLGRDQTTRPRAGLGPDAPDWLAEQGWQTQFQRCADLAESYGRARFGAPGNGYLIAVRESGGCGQ